MTAMERRPPARLENAGVQSRDMRNSSDDMLKRELQHAGSETGAPPVIVFSLGTHGNWDDLLATGASVLGIDWQFPLAHARRLLPADIALQGNLAPALLGDATPEMVAQETRAVLETMRGRKGHIFNLGHGVLPDTPVENVRAFVNAVKQFSVQYH